jgi:hypothetical protein
MSAKEVSAARTASKLKEAIHLGIVKEGSNFKNWKVFCAEVGLPAIGTNTNRKRMYERELGNVVGYSVLGTVIRVESIHEVPYVTRHKNSVWKGALDECLISFLESRLHSSGFGEVILSNEELYRSLGLLKESLTFSPNPDIQYSAFAGLTRLNMYEEQLVVFDLIREKYKEVTQDLLNFMADKQLIQYTRTYRVVYESGKTEVLSDENALIFLEARNTALIEFGATADNYFKSSGAYNKFLSRSLELYSVGERKKNPLVHAYKVHKIAFGKVSLELAKRMVHYSTKTPCIDKTAYDSLSKAVRTLNSNDWRGKATEEELRKLVEAIKDKGVKDSIIPINNKTEEFHQEVVRKKVLANAPHTL